MKDKYDKAITYLKKNPEEIENAWINGGLSDADKRPGSALFKYIGRGPMCGCPSMIKHGDWDAPTPELTAAIRADARIPENNEDITIESLTAFAEWQRRADKEIRGAVPA